MTSDEITWSEWYSFDEQNIANVPSLPGVFRMHAAMKILLIDNDEDMQKGLLKALKAPCTSEAGRFCYFQTDSHKQLKEKLIHEYKEKHDGKLPKCMQ